VAKISLHAPLPGGATRAGANFDDFLELSHRAHVDVVGDRAISDVRHRLAAFGVFTIKMKTGTDAA